MPSTILSQSATAVVAPATRAICGRLPSHLTLLTAFRFIAAAWVVVFHLNFPLGDIFPEPFNHVVSNGAYAMSFFFVLSGAVLAYGYFDLGASPGEAWRFYRARLARIYPAYALMHLLGLFWLDVPLSDWARWSYVNALSALGVQAWLPPANIGLNGATWSISCEFFFYLLFPAVLPLVRALPKPAQVFRAVFYLCLFVGFLGFSDFAFAREGTFPIAYNSPLIRFPEFLIGMLLGVALRRTPGSAMSSVWPTLAAAVGFFLVSCNTVYEVGMWTRVNILVVPAVAALIFTAGRYEIAQPEIFTTRVWRLLKYLGHASFAMFLIHLPLLAVLRALLDRKDGVSAAIEGAPLLAAVLMLLSTIVCGIALHEGFEKPIRRKLLRALQGGQAGVAG